MEPLTRVEKNKKLYRQHRAKRWLASTFLALCAAVFLFFVWFRPLKIGNAAMEPTLKEGAVAVANRLTKFFRSPKRTDIVWFTEGKTERVRRIVALPGETVSGRDGHICINTDYLLEEEYVETQTPDFEPFTVPEGTVFCLPDNRNCFTGLNAESYCVKLGDIKGIVAFTVE